MKKLQTPWDSDEMLMVDIGCFERGCAMVAGDWAAGERPECRATVDAEAYERLRANGKQDWSEIEALRASLREHMAEIQRLRAAGRQALDALCLPCDRWNRRQTEIINASLATLRAALSEEAMQRLTDVQQEMERPADTGKTSDHIPDAGKMVVSVREYRTVEPGAWLFQHEETGLTECVDAQQVEWGFERNNPRWQKIGPLYTAPPKREPLTDEEIEEICWTEMDRRLLSFARAIERAHGIRGEE